MKQLIHIAVMLWISTYVINQEPIYAVPCVAETAAFAAYQHCNKFSCICKDNAILMCDSCPHGRKLAINTLACPVDVYYSNGKLSCNP